MTEDLQGLKRDHDFVIFDEVTDEEEDGFHLLRLTKFRAIVKPHAASFDPAPNVREI